MIGGNNYVKLRDAAQALGGTEKRFAVTYDKAAETVALTSGMGYEPIGGELAGPADVAAVQAKTSSQLLSLDGVELNLTAYEIGGANYVKLRDLAMALDCAVTYDKESGAVGMDTALPYTA